MFVAFSPFTQSRYSQSMADDDQNQDNIDTDIPERPLDPSRNSSDLMGDPSGMTGWTVGSGEDTSAEPTEKQPSTDNLPGGILQNETTHPPTGTPKEAVSTKMYDRNNLQEMSREKAAEAEEMADEAESFTSVSDMVRDTEDEDQPDTYDPSKLRQDEVGRIGPIINSESAPYVNPENIGEQEVSGSTPDPSTDDDALYNAQAVGGQQGEDSEHPKELNTGVDESEEYIRHH